MIRLAKEEDIPQIAGIYDRILDRQEEGGPSTGWQRGIYPTADTAREALALGELYVLEEAGLITAAARINQEQVDVYAQCPWKYAAPPDRVLVLHTLVVDPAAAGKGCGTRFVRFYEALALEKGCPCLRMDTNEVNTSARKLYRRLGYREAAILPCTFNGISGVNLVCLEKYLMETR